MPHFCGEKQRQILKLIGKSNIYELWLIVCSKSHKDRGVERDVFVWGNSHTCAIDPVYFGLQEDKNC